MKTRILIALIAVTLAACAPVAAPAQNETPVPAATITPPPPTTTVAILTPSPLPTQPIIPLLTPDTIQVEKWKEYQTFLAKSLFSYISPEEVLCEWDILKRSDQDVYVWAVCKSGFESSSTPAVIHLGEDGNIQSIEIPGPGLSDYSRMFPTDVQEKFYYYRHGRAGEMSDHIEWRWEHPEEPPLIILSTTPAAQPLRRELLTQETKHENSDTHYLFRPHPDGLRAGTDRHSGHTKHRHRRRMDGRFPYPNGDAHRHTPAADCYADRH